MGLGKAQRDPTHSDADTTPAGRAPPREIEISCVEDERISEVPSLRAKLSAETNLLREPNFFIEIWSEPNSFRRC